jgi:crossover junction endodeoxyribonuclease RuvC
MRVIGLDLSLRSTGVAEWSTHEPVFRSTRVLSDPTPSKTLLERHDRLQQIEDEIIRLVWSGPLPALVVVEGPSMGSIQGAHEMSGNWWRVVGRLMQAGLPVVEVPPTSVKLYATGSGSSHGATKVTKLMVINEVNRRYDIGPILLGRGDSDRADAIVLAAMGIRMISTPVDPYIPAPNLRALTKIRLPEGLTA